MIAAGEAIPNFYRGGLKEEIVKCSPYGEAVSAELYRLVIAPS